MSSVDLPRTFQVSRKKSFGMLVLGVMFVGIGVLMVLDDNSFGWAGIILFGVLVPASIWQLISPGTLRVDETSIEVRQFWWTRQYALAECGEFTPGVTRVRERVIFDHSGSTTTGWRRWVETRIGIDNCIPDTYGLGGEGLCTLLNGLRVNAAKSAR